MRQTLKLHPDSHCNAVTSIDVLITRPCLGNLTLRYFVTGKMRDLRLPPAGALTRGEGLWNGTCFEAFIRATSNAAYYEFNFSPARQWAAYHFNDYRSGMRVACEISAPHIEGQRDNAGYQIEAALAFKGLPGLSGDAIWRLGASAVIEEANGHKSFWALAHPPGRADFHHPDCFAHELTVRERQ